MPQAPFTLSLGRSSLGLVFLALALCQPANAQEKPDAPKPKQTACCSSDICLRQHHHGLPEAPKPKQDRRIFWTGTVLLAASKTADAITTRQSLDRGNYETDPVFGRHPSPARQSIINLGFFAAQSGVFYLTERNRHAWVRWTGRALLGHEILEHSRLAACNSGLNPQGTQIQKCLPLVPYL